MQSRNNAPVLSQYLCDGIANWFSRNEYIRNNISTIYNYLCIDVPVNQMTAICVYPIIMNDLKKKTGWECGIIGVDVIFDMSIQRSDKAFYIQQTLANITGQFLTNPVYIMDFLSTYYCAGLQVLNCQGSIDLSDMRKQLKEAKRDTTFTIKLPYEVNIYLNQTKAWAYGMDYWSPIVPVYEQNTGNNIEIKTIKPE